MPTYQEDKLPVDRILLDPNNFRFQDTKDFVNADASRFHEKSVQDRAYRKLRDSGNLAQLKASIVRNGFIPVERIVVHRYATEADKFVVVEGNRRIAALRWIAEDDAAGVNIPENVKGTLGAVPVIIIEGEGGLEHRALMGVRHVSGISQWGGYQRAKLPNVVVNVSGLKPVIDRWTLPADGRTLTHETYDLKEISVYDKQ